MMKGKRKKLVAWLLALSVLMSPTTGFRAFADPVDAAQDSTVMADVDSDTAATVDQGTNGSGTAAADSNGQTEPQEPVTPVDPSGTDTPSDVPDTTVDPAATEEPAETDGTEDQEAQTEDPAVEDGGLINNLFLGEKSLQAPGEQNLIVSFGDGSEQLTSVKLILAGEDGRQSEIPLTEQKESYYRFTKAYESSEAGTYRLVAFSYDLDGHKKRIDFKKIGISAEFTVNSEVSAQSDDCAEEAGISVTALTSDDISDHMTEQIESAIQEVADEAVENVNEGAVALDSSSTDQSYSRAGVSKELTALTDQAVTLGSYSAKKSYTGASTVVVVLDPGHGGSDNGASANGLKEKDINLRIAQACKTELEKNTGVKVYMTRTTDKYVSLEARVLAAKTFGATLFVSIHMNSSTKESANGAEVYYPNANYNPAVSNEGKVAAQSILNELVDLGLANRGIKFLNSTSDDDDDDDEAFYDDGSISDYYSVIRNSKKNGFPGIIVEHAFLTNDDDAKALKDPTFISELGKADARGILKYCQTKTDYSSVYNFSYYINSYPDLKRAFGNDPVAAMQHFITLGMNERRQASKEFNVDAYMNRYPDLQAAFGSNSAAYYMHYINFGRKEGRIATVDGSDVNAGTNAVDKVPNNTAANTVYDGMDYKDVYDYEYYINRYGDLAAVFKGDYAGALKHFVENGMNEGRQAKGTFNVNSYAHAEKNDDLRKAFGENLKLYYIHYIEYGKAEGRPGIYKDEHEGDNRVDTELKTYVTKYGLVDYAPVYDYNYYIAQYPDVKQACESDPTKVLQHFVRHGMDEGRIAKDKDVVYNKDTKDEYTVHEFNVYAYKSAYSDLRSAYGNDLKKYYLHYINHGRAEGRTSVFKEVTEYQGVNYSSVYDFNYYTKKYSDLATAFGNDPAGAIQHFLTFGIKEGRQACEEFNISAYKNNYVDLRNAFGDNDMAYVRHYIECGKDEKRNAKSAVLHSILINNQPQKEQTSVNQMVMYFLANASYPTYYANNTNVKTIKEFCQLYYDECWDEGIRPEVAFCQAMKETSFLKFGGDVKINQYNFAGLGATGNSESGATFNSIKEGIRAHVQHLKAYATTDSLKNPCIDPRYKFVTKGCAPYVEWLGQKENPIPGQGWATDQGYGYSIINDYMNKLSTYSK